RLSLPQGLFEERQGLTQLPSVTIRRGQVVHTGERIGVVGAELRLPLLQSLLVECQGLVEPAGSAVRLGKVVHTSESIGVVRTELARTQSSTIFVVLHRYGQIAHVPIRLSQCIADPGLHE